MKKLILISALLFFPNAYAHDHSPGARLEISWPLLGANYSDGDIFLRAQAVVPPTLVDVVCVFEDSFEAPIELHLSFDGDIKSLIWVREVAIKGWLPYIKNGLSIEQHRPDPGPGLPEKFITDLVYTPSTGVIELSRVSYTIPFALESEAFRSDKYSISLYTSKITYSMKWDLDDYTKFHKSMGDCTFITLPKSIEEEIESQPKKKT